LNYLYTSEFVSCYGIASLLIFLKGGDKGPMQHGWCDSLFTCYISSNLIVCHELLQDLSPEEAFSSFVPDYQLYSTGGMPSRAAQNFQIATSSIFYECSLGWNRSAFWNRVSSRTNDAVFCQMQATRVLILHISNEEHTILY
jgi:hypothetical protein